jgi:DNA-binding NtrC family response regulator
MAEELVVGSHENTENSDRTTVPRHERPALGNNPRTPMSADLIVFVGYSSDAKDEALAVCELEPYLRDILKGLNHAAGERSRYSHLEVFNWESDSEVGVGGQEFAISPHLREAAIAIFVFKGRVGKVTRQEIESIRNRPRDARVPTFAMFTDTPPDRKSMTDPKVARAWADVLDFREQLTVDWDAGVESKSVTPLQPYRDRDHLKELLRARISDLLPRIVVPNNSNGVAPSKDVGQEVVAHEPELGSPFSSILDSPLATAKHDPGALDHYRTLLRPEAQSAYPPELSADAFLRTAGYSRSGKLTVAGVLLFTSKPSALVPAAVVRCSRYDGDTKDTPRHWNNCDGPLLQQILDAREFVARSVRKNEIPVETSMQSLPLYEYPMVCVREMLANAVCHRDWQDEERFVYVTLFQSRLEIRSPGTWKAKHLVDRKQYPLGVLTGESVQRNMRLAHAISAVGVMEVEGSGIPTALADCAACGAPEPVVELRDGYVCVTIFPRAEWEVGVASDNSAPRAEVVAVPTANQLPTLPPIGEALSDVQRLRDKLVAENTYLRREIKDQLGSKIVGTSAAIRRVLEQAEQVASTDSTVLLLGETGTGKELFATQIHELSQRRGRAMVRVNCSAIPSTLIESELFGREKGAFTGALSRQIGRFELADHSTIFLDEIGDLPFDIQVKLLRVLEERQIERLGNPKGIKVDTRIITATHRDLEKLVSAGGFREDLFYRLNVFPIRVPPLRERSEDIPILVWRFVEEFSRSFGKRIEAISRENMAALQQYLWPGNIRELRNVVERAVIVADGPELKISIPPLQVNAARDLVRLRDVEKEHILSVLNSTGWRIRGAGGAAERLGLRPTTLETRMAKLRIRRPKRA